METKHKTSRRLILFCLVLGGADFAFDLMIPLGVAGGVLYVAVVLASMWSPQRSFTLVVAIAASALTMLGLLLSPEGGVLWMVLLNRFLALFAIWVTAILSLQRKRAEAALLRNNDELEARVQDRTRDLADAYQQLKKEFVERAQAEIALSESEDRFRRAVLDAPFPIMIHAEDGEILQINTVWTDLTGYRAEDIPTMSHWTERAYGQRQKPIKARIDRLYDLDERVKEGEYKIATLGGELVVWDFSSSPLGKLPDGRRVVISIAMDVTARKRAEDELHESEERFRAIFEQAAESIVLFDPESGTIVEFNDRACENLGYTRAEFEKLKLSDVEGIESAEEIVGHARKVAEEGADTFETKHRHKNGELRDILVAARVISVRRKKLIASVWHDITERKQAEAALRESEQRYRGIVEDQTELICRWLPDGRLTFVNDAYCRVFERSREQLVGNTFMPLIPREDRSRVERHFKSLGRENPIATHEHRVILPNGETRWQQWTNRAILDPYGNIVEYQSVGRDVTQRIAAEEAMKASEERYHDLYDNAPDMFCSVDGATGRVLECNQTLAAAIGYTKNELIGRHISELYHPDSEMDRQGVFKAFTQLGQVRDAELQLRRKDGGKLDVSLNVSAIRDEQGNVLSSRSIWRDITNRKKLEEALRKANDELEARVAERTAELSKANEDLQKEITEREQAERGRDHERSLLHALMDRMPDNIFFKDAQSRFTRINQAMAEYFGLDSPADAIGKNDGDFFGEEHACRTYKDEQQVMRAGQSLVAKEEQEVWPDGRRTWVSTTKVPLRSDDGRVIGTFGISRDITAGKQAEQERIESEERFRQLAENIDQVFWLTDWTNKKLLYVSPAYEPVFGRSRESAFKDRRGWLQLVHPDERERIGRSFAEAADAGRSVEEEYRIVRQDGAIRWIRDRAYPMRNAEGEVFRIVGLAEDITERKHAEEVLRKRTNRQSAITELGQRALGGEDLTVLMNEAVRQLCATLDVEYTKILELLPDGKSLLLRAGVGWKDGLVGHATVGTELNSQAGYTLRSDKPVIVEDLRCETRFTGPPLLRNHRVVSGMSVLIQGRGGTPWGVLGAHTTAHRTFSQDDANFLQAAANTLGEAIARKRAEEVNSQLVAALDSAGEAIMITDVDGVIQYVNSAFERIHGYAREEVIGKNPRVFKSGWQDDGFYREMWAALLRGEVWRGSFVNRAKDGALIDVEETIAPVRASLNSAVSYVSVERDITERKRSERRARQQEADLAHVARLNTMGEMATGLAHELNQPLAAIVNLAEACIRRLQSEAPQTDKVLKNLEEVALQGQRAGEIIRRLRDFTRRGEPKRAPTDINKVVREATQFAAGEARLNQVTIRVKLAESPPAVSADAVQIGQVVLNLARNAIDSMAENGQGPRNLTIQTSTSRDNRLEVAVRDTGPGISTEALPKIFDPFFTTKTEGMGMGLSISRTIIEAHEGRIWVTTNPGRGVTMRFSLPIPDRSAQA